MKAINKHKINNLQSNKRNPLEPFPKIAFPEQLPICKHIEEISKAINEHQVIIVAGETGSGKTTQLPKICLAMGRGINGMIGHTQPRRLAAKTVALRIAEELKVELGKQVGYQVRFDDRSDENGYIKLMTDGILLNELHHDPLLKKYDTLIIDEAHERTLNIDFILGILHQLLKKRADLKVIITSATIEPKRFSKHFNNAPIIEVSGRSYPVETRYQPLFDGIDEQDESASFEQAACSAVEELMSEGRGDILIFLPGEQDIRHLADYLRKHLKSSAEVLPLYSRLAQSEQMRIFSSHANQRIILSTNVAETSLTVPGIHYVIDSGKARISRYSIRSKIQRLPIEAISQASANQRKGRCGRTADGVCIRLYSEDDFNSRDEFTEPEIKRTNLASVILQMSILALGNIEDFPFLDPPDHRAINDGYKLLYELGAMNEDRKLTELGRQLARLPVDPRLGRMLLAGAENSALHELLIITAAMSLADPRERPIEKQQQADEKHRRFIDQDSDFVALLNLWNYIHKTKQEMSWNQLRKLCQKEFINFNRLREWREIYAQLKRQLEEQRFSINKTEADYEAIHKAILAGFVSQIGERTIDGDYQSTRQVRFHLFPGSGLFKSNKKDKNSSTDETSPQTKSSAANWLVVGELVETQKLYGRLVAKIEPAWVESIAGNLLKANYSDPYWSRKGARAMVKENLSLYGLTVIANRPKTYADIDAEKAHQLFIHHALVEGDYITRAAAIIHNRHCLEQVEALEHRARRRDILVEQDYLQNFYNERIPTHITNGPVFEKWYQKIDAPQQQGLELSVDDLIRDDADDINREAYPETLVVNNISLNLEYHFEPGAIDDGLHIIMPIGYINQFNDSDFDWLVPGMLEAKVVALLRGLPKPLRRNFVPVPDYAKALIETLTQGKESLTQQMAKNLKRMSGILINEADFNQQLLAENLVPLFYLIGMDSENIIDTSRSLKQLQKNYANQALDFLENELEQQVFQNYPSCGFEVNTQSERGNSVINLFSGIQIVNNNVSIKVFDSADQAELNTRDSLKLLLIKSCSKKIREMKNHLPELAKAELIYATLEKADSIFFEQDHSGIYLDLFLLICDIKITKNASAINSSELFEQLDLTITQALLPEIIEHNNLLIEIFRQAAVIRKKLIKLSSPSMISVAAKLRDKVDSLLYCGFIATTGWEQLYQYPRYLKALACRYDTAERNPQAERERSIVWDKWWSKYLQVEKQSVGNKAHNQTLKEFRWLLEEFHVSLFAQQLGTKKSVSEKRLAKLLEQLI